MLFRSLALRRGQIKKKSRLTAQAFIGTAGDFRALLDRLESCLDAEIDGILEQVVSAASQFGKVVQLPDLLQNVSPRELQPSTHEGLTRRLAKLARYHEFSRYLCHTAWKHTELFGNVQVNTVSLNKRYFDTSRAGSTSPSLAACVTRCCTGDATLLRLCQKMGVRTTEAANNFNIQVNRTINEAKIHAEVQIITHYDLNPSKLPPRAISSNKNACYLCDKFIKLHGKYHIPQTHGRLWPEWKLPALAAYEGLRERLGQDLASHIFAASRADTLREQATGHQLPQRKCGLPIVYLGLDDSGCARVAAQFTTWYRRAFGEQRP